MNFALDQPKSLSIEDVSIFLGFLGILLFDMSL